jgi:antitoxin CptB
MRHCDRFNRLKWLCRRGMKELDVLLERFLDRNRSELCQGDWPELESLLQCEDDRLWDWLQQPSCTTAAPYRSLLQRIRDDPERPA